ncbi:SDR family oxidoreductase [Shewanella basaltis]|uniref:UDP-glucose 4-epimerase family protein n=1 Tax=Shewanella basaltis TaxID=472183 RepID=UPI00200D1BC0|nr:SDR family oxidoreductase [Shewanella basaltis]MCL1112981.1 SDR family oxidoreductase [Shewanella basaltis]
MNILITGGTGFVGRQLIKSLPQHTLSILSRSSNSFDDSVTCFSGDISSNTCHTHALKNQSVVIHCAARVHMMGDSSNSLQEYLDVNTYGTLNLAKQAYDAGVKRFIFISSIKVNGESTNIGGPYKHSDPHNPKDCYGQSKSEAEIQLIDLSKKTGLEVVIIRPTLVYGPGVKANFASLMNFVSKGFPMPFGCVTENKRSLVSVTNLVDLIITCIDHPKAANQTFLVSDDYDVSTYQLVFEMTKALNKSTWQVPIPIWCYKLVGRLFNKSEVVDRLIGSLQVDISHTKDTLGWKPPQSLPEGFRQVAQTFLQSTTK